MAIKIHLIRSGYQSILLEPGIPSNVELLQVLVVGNVQKNEIKV